MSQGINYIEYSEQNVNTLASEFKIHSWDSSRDMVSKLELLTYKGQHIVFLKAKPEQKPILGL